MTYATYNGTQFDEEDLVKAVKRTYALINMLEVVQYASYGDDLSGELEHIGAEMRSGIDDNVITDLRHYIEGIEDIIGKVQPPASNPAAMAQAMEKHMGLRD
jgi:hypothetical protein